MRLGHMLVFFVRALMGVPIALRHYRSEFVRLVSDISWGNGSLVVGGGTAGVAIVLGITVGALVGIEGYNFLDLLGLGPATGIISSLVNTRELAPIAASLAFATQAGCRFTAQLGSMRIAEEIDALDSLAIRPIPYLVTTRLMASVVAVVPLYVACLAVSYLTTQVVVYVISGGSTGSYLHYFSLMLSGQDILYSLIKTIIFVWIASTVQCYYGFYASGGPEGVGVAAGHAMRASITVVIMVNMLLTMALWSVDPAQGSGGEKYLSNSLDPDGRGPSNRQLLGCGVSLLVVVALVTAALLVKSTGRLDPYVRVVADLVNVGDGLPQRSDVKYHGVLVGMVDSVTPAADGDPNFVHIDLKPEYAQSIPAWRDRAGGAQQCLRRVLGSARRPGPGTCDSCRCAHIPRTPSCRRSSSRPQSASCATCWPRPVGAVKTRRWASSPR